MNGVNPTSSAKLSNLNQSAPETKNQYPPTLDGEKKTTKAGKDLQEYRPPQQARKRIEELNRQIDNRFFHYCETLGTTPLKNYQQNNHESWIIQNLADNESQVSNIRQEKYPTNALKKFGNHETVNLIRLKQTVETNTIYDEQNEHTEETIKRAEKDFSRYTDAHG